MLDYMQHLRDFCDEYIKLPTPNMEKPYGLVTIVNWSDIEKASKDFSPIFLEAKTRSLQRDSRTYQRLFSKA